MLDSLPRRSRALALAALAAIAMLLGVALGAAPAMATPGGQVCAPLSSGKIDTTGDPQSVTITAPAGQLITGYCVKAGSANQGDGPVYVTLTQPVASITFAAPSGKSVSHYSYSLTTTPMTTTTTVAVAPTLTDVCGPDFQLSVPPDGPGYGFSIDASGAPGGAGTIVVTATLESGFVWSDGSTTPMTWSFPVTATPCTQTAPEPSAPTLADACGVAYDLSVPADTAAFSYSVDASGVVDGTGTVLVTATPSAGYLWGDGSSTPRSWSFPVADAACTIPSIPAPTFHEVCGPDGPTPYALPAAGEHHRYDVVDPGVYDASGARTIVVTAVLDEGWAPAAGVATTWTETLSDEPCDQPALAQASAAVVLTAATCTTDGSVSPGAIEHATWRPATAGASGEVVLVADADTGAAFDSALPGVSADGSTRTFAVVPAARDASLCAGQPTSGAEPPTSAPTPRADAPTPRVPAIAQAAPVLPRTGMEVIGLAWLGAAVALAGLWLALRRRPTR